MEIVIALGVILTCGYFFGLIAEKMKLPRVSAYLLAGILFSDHYLGDLVNFKFSLWSDYFAQICLGFIAYIVGGEIKLESVLKHKKEILLSTLFSSLTPVIFVFIVFYTLGVYFNLPHYMALILASISSTTAPAATVAVIEQYKTNGELTDTTLGIVALDDALGILIFITMSSFFFPNGENGGVLSLVHEIFSSIAIGAFFGYSLSKFAKLSPSNDYLLPLLAGLVLLLVGLAHHYNFSALLACITLGLIANNSNIKNCSRVSLLLPIQHLEEFIFITFFTFAGTHFSPQHFASGFLLILTYILTRAAGKYFGAYVGFKMGNSSNKELPSLLGLTLFPQAGVAIGLLIQVVQLDQVAPFKESLFNIILGSTIIYEVIGPITAKWAFEKSGEMNA